MTFCPARKEFLLLKRQLTECKSPERVEQEFAQSLNTSNSQSDAEITSHPVAESSHESTDESIPLVMASPLQSALARVFAWDGELDTPEDVRLWRHSIHSRVAEMAASAEANPHVVEWLISSSRTPPAPV